MRWGWYISGGAHLALILVVMFGGLFRNRDMPKIAVAEVSLISEAEYAAMVTPGGPPSVAPQVATPAAPKIEAAPPKPKPDTTPERTEAAKPATAEQPDNSSIAVPDPVPEAEVQAQPPALETPPALNESKGVADAVPAPAPRVAPKAAPPKPEMAEVSPDVTPDVAPAPEAPPEKVVEEKKPAAPKEAAPQIVTEADKPTNETPLSSPRPPSRPTDLAALKPKPQPAPKAEPEKKPQPDKASAQTAETKPDPAPTPAPETNRTNDAVAAALAEAAEPQVPEGPPMTGGERDALRLAVQQCWIVDPGSQASQVAVTIGVELDREGRVSGDIRQISATGGDTRAQQTAFEAARRAVLRCQKSGYPLPPEKYGQWREIEMTFNLDGMSF